MNEHCVLQKDEVDPDIGLGPWGNRIATFLFYVSNCLVWTAFLVILIYFLIFCLFCSFLLFCVWIFGRCCWDCKSYPCVCAWEPFFLVCSFATLLHLLLTDLSSKALLLILKRLFSTMEIGGSLNILSCLILMSVFRFTFFSYFSIYFVSLHSVN